MSRLLGAMKLKIREIVLKEQRPFSFVDFREFKVGGKSIKWIMVPLETTFQLSEWPK
jgi:hypothetical protein